MFKGSFVALVTPFRDGAIDEAAYQGFVDWQIGQGTHGLVPCGTTGESPTLSHAEHMRVVELCVEVAQGRVPVIAGSGSNSTAEAIQLTRHAKEAGADAALIITPYYNKPSQEGLYQHYKAIQDAVDLPILIYNIPGRCVVDMSVATMARLGKLPNIIGVKDATADLARPAATRHAIGDDFCQLSGEDATVLAFLSEGGHGCISVSANVAPKLLAEMHTAWMKGDHATARGIHERLMPVHEAMFVDTNPCPVKYAVSLQGHCSGELRLPLVEVSKENKEQIRQALETAGLLA